MTLAPYDIFKKDAGVILWVEAVQDLQFAERRVRDLALGTSGEYVIFDQRTQRIVSVFEVRRPDTCGIPRD